MALPPVSLHLLELRDNKAVRAATPGSKSPRSARGKLSAYTAAPGPSPSIDNAKIREMLTQMGRAPSPRRCVSRAIDRLQAGRRFMTGRVAMLSETLTEGHAIHQHAGCHLDDPDPK